jgi:GT2 family glycosyltransferase
MELSEDEQSQDIGGQESSQRQESGAGRADQLPFSLVLTPISRSPTRLEETTVRTVMARPVPMARQGSNASCRWDGSAIRSTRAEVQRASILIVTFNSLVFTRLCLESVLFNTDYPDYEIIVLDNGSHDGTRDYLHELERRFSQIEAVFNSRNLGFAHAVNQGLARAHGDVMVLLNNDTIVPPGWLGRLVRYLDDPAIGLVGPVTNRAGNEAQIEVPYRTYGEFLRFAQDYAQAHRDELSDIRMLAMFCVAMRRALFEQVGLLDERFEIGLFEDDDYAMRVRSAGYRVVCAEDVCVHHFGQASLGELAASGEYGKLFHANRRRWEEKWRRPWHPYQHRSNRHYHELTEQIREVVHTTLPPDATVIVVSKGDEELLKLEGRRAWHFPQGEDGAYAGHYPASSTEAIAQMETLRARGADFLLLPRTAYWWLEHYVQFKQHLESRYRMMAQANNSCSIFALCERRIDAPTEYPREAL